MSTSAISPSSSLGNLQALQNVSSGSQASGVRHGHHHHHHSEGTGSASVSGGQGSATPSVNTSGQTVGQLLDTKA